ncbi:hypothetical protein [Mucilaginibacter phyllosphaerae]|uniref:Outer membrane protein beta-barrel domain-containing protein n=1 Tax=Mucilaginibacter phyllosphaerae TaxID=1812349 RepID=A0A4Y8AH82_9SPHI|nr:hypothetical protein [Mucilaginibacter phyllosphaerae]MBB3968801.1 hypothetical protein [Mucilaginibacter phyllosphaerae]TEW67565.1 hypothetical protein E2R65_06135 [Mucilaginibacter phyllosphaerae]GGH13801.1 hypothetical protein GCM10007352_21500 [Mucilaginibacter phyllosphaerae]
MKEEKEDSIDKLFSRGLSDPGDNASYREQDWEAMEAMLDRDKPKSIGRSLIPLLCAVAAMLLLVIGWLYLKPNTIPGNYTQQAANKKQPVNKTAGKYSLHVQQPAVSKNNALSVNNNNAISAGNIGRKNNSLFTVTAAPGSHIVTGTPGYLPQHPQKNNVPDTIITPTAANTIAKADTTTTNSTTMLAGNTIDTAGVAKKPALVSVVDDVKPAYKKPGKASFPSTGYAFRPTFALSLIASPDINSVQGFSQNKVGTNAGLLLTVGVSRRFTVTTGAIYADKPYMTPFANYATAYKFATNPQSVTASCTVLDIPLNIGYQVYSKGANKFSLGTGLSSYFMLRENYIYNYAGGYPDGPASYNIRNRNKHLLGVLNLNATYQRAISSKFGLGVQPYFKLPLTGIGYGQVNLKSAGVAVGVSWNINTGIKP